MMNITQSPKKRPITSIFLLISFIYLVPSGILVFIAEEGSAQFKHIAGASHWVASIIFLVSTIVHVILNWRAMKRYMVTEASNVSILKKEFTFVFVIVTFFIIFSGTYEFFI